MAVSLGRFARPNTVSIWAADPVTLGKVVAFILTNVAIPGKKNVRLDLAHQGAGSLRFTPTRNPVERLVTSNIKREPETLTISGSISATPLGLSTILGTLGSVIRRDLREVAKLRKLFELREPLIVVTPWRVYPPMAGTAIDDTHTGENKVDLTLSFEEIRIVDPLLVTGAVDLDELLSGAASEAALGGQSTEVVTAPAGVAGGLG